MIYDFIVVGAGIAGASAAFELAEHGKVLIIEAEPHPGYHSTGRSAALFTPNFGNALVRSIHSVSEAFFHNPPSDFIDGPLLKPRGALSVAAPGSEDKLDALLALSTATHPIEEVVVSEASRLAPFVREERVSRAVLEHDVYDIDVAMLLQSYLQKYKLRGGKLVTNEAVQALNYTQGCWTVSTRNNSYQANTIINAAGAWADEVGCLASASSIGLVAKRRTVIVVDAPVGCQTADLPLVEFVNTGAYIKPESGKLMASLGDATPTVAQDVQAEDLDIAVLIDHIERETHIQVASVLHQWAGLRSFVKDDSPVVGFDSIAPNFVWLAGQGGFGIMMSPTLARATASICLSAELPSDLLSAGVTSVVLSGERLR